MHHYIITRFSIITNGVILSTAKNYKQQLFSDARLNIKFNAFEHVTFPSVTKQTYKNYTWFLLISIYLPEKYKKRLNKVIKTNNNIKIIYVENDNYDDYINTNEVYSTIRLDDDDGIHKDLLLNIAKYKNESGKIISFPNGNLYKLNKYNNIIIGKKIYRKNIALGLAAINMNIYKCGNHNLVHTKFDVIYDEMDKAYICYCSPFCDTKRKFRK